VSKRRQLKSNANVTLLQFVAKLRPSSLFSFLLLLSSPFLSFLLTYAYHSINLTFSLLSRFVCLLACLLKGPDGRVIFKAFLTHEFNLDLFQFWLDTEEYKKKSRKKRYLSKKIYFKYLQPGSEHEVNSCFISNCSWGQL